MLPSAVRACWHYLIHSLQVRANITVEPLQALPFKNPSLPSILRTFPFLSVLPSNHCPFSCVCFSKLGRGVPFVVCVRGLAFWRQLVCPARYGKAGRGWRMLLQCSLCIVVCKPCRWLARRRSFREEAESASGGPLSQKRWDDGCWIRTNVDFPNRGTSSGEKATPGARPTAPSHLVNY